MHPKRKSAKSGVPKRPTAGTHAAPAKCPRIAGVGTHNSGPQNDEPADDDDDSDDPTAFETRTEERFHQIELFQQDMYTRLVEGFDELKRTTRTSPPTSGPLANNTQPIPSTPRLPYVATGAPHLSGTPLCPPPVGILSQVSWVDASLVQSISAGNFDIFNLPKLHRDNSVRRKHTARSVEGILLSTGNTPQLEVVNGATRLHTYFKEIGSFYSAWLVYVTIRIHFCPERAPGL